VVGGRECSKGGSGYGPVVSSCEYCDEPSGSGATELVLREQGRTKSWRHKAVRLVSVIKFCTV
jgi:hypothetical protein